jgi:NAD(P)-dependent dehydrogenase (short-subunit alcohol dehydrogenase family)
LGIVPVIGSLDDAALLRQEALASDGVINAADSMHRAGLEALIDGMRGSGKPLLHTSGIGMVSRDAAGDHTVDKIVDDVEPIAPGPHPAQHALREQDQEAERLRMLLQVNLVALTELTHVFGRAMAQRGKGEILLVASLAAYQSTPLYAAYGASKEYILSLGVALNVVLGPAVRVAVLAPGLMYTKFLEVAGHRPTAAMRRTMSSTAEAVRTGAGGIRCRTRKRRRRAIEPPHRLPDSPFSRRYLARLAYRAFKS